MIDRDRAMDIIRRALAYSSSDMTEAVLEYERLSLTRFAESKISDNLDREETILYIRCIRGGKIGVVTTGDISDEGIKKAVADCESMQKYLIADKDFVSLPGPEAWPEKARPAENKLVKATSECGPKERAAAVREINGVGRKGGLKASGAFRIEESRIAVANSLNVERYFQGNHAEVNLTYAGAEGNSGWAQDFDPDVSAIDITRLAVAAAWKAMESREPASIPDGKYTVVLEPAAVGQLILMLSFMGFGGRTFYQRRSFMSGKIGEAIAGENFTIFEDPTDPDFRYMPFDYEGVPRKKVMLIEKGIARNVVYDSYYARLAGAESTGNALTATNSYGPYPKTLVVEKGDGTLDEMIASTENGVLITHFWYLNFLNPMRTMVTGTTRDGTFLIRDGQVDSAVRNMRTNQSLLEAFSNIEMISKERILYPQYSVLMKVPAMKIGDFDLALEEEDESKC